jgi:hypothetical protein
MPEITVIGTYAASADAEDRPVEHMNKYARYNASAKGRARTDRYKSTERGGLMQAIAHRRNDGQRYLASLDARLASTSPTSTR